MNSNEAFLRNLYAHGPFQGHGFVCSPVAPTIAEHPDYDFTLSDKPVEGWVPWVVGDYVNQQRMTEATGDDAVPCARLGTGTHIYAAAFGCDVHRYPDNNPSAKPLVTSAAEADRLEVPDIWKSPTLYRIFELAAAVRRELGPQAYLAPPDMQSGFDTAALIWDKTGFLCAMLDEADRDAVKRLAARCAALFKTFVAEFRREFPQCSPCHCPFVWAPPELGPWVSNDECGAFSAELFEEFCLPELADLGQTFGGVGMHCCAAAEHQFESFKRIPGFYAFNRVAAARGYGPVIEHFGQGPSPVFVLGWLTEGEIEFLVRNATPSMRFIFNQIGCTVDEGKAWLERMRRLSARTA